MERINQSRSQRQRSPIATRKPWVQELDWDARYGDINQYKKQVAIAHRKTHNHCCVCLTSKSNQLHHASYGNDRIGISTFPVCDRCHSGICHSSDNWIKDKTDPVWKSRNTPEFTKRLRLGYQLLYGGIEL